MSDTNATPSVASYNTKEALAYIVDQGLPINIQNLYRMRRVRNDAKDISTLHPNEVGPKFIKPGPRRVIYRQAALDQWISAIESGAESMPADVVAPVAAPTGLPAGVLPTSGTETPSTPIF